MLLWDMLMVLALGSSTQKSEKSISGKNDEQDMRFEKEHQM
jgi:hypothetical protein